MVVLDIMSNHEELVAEIPTVEKMPIADRLKLAKKRRAAQLKSYAQFEKQSSKEKDHKTKKSTGGTARRKSTRLRFVDCILLLDAAAKNDLVEGNAAQFSELYYTVIRCYDHHHHHQLSLMKHS